MKQIACLIIITVVYLFPSDIKAENHIMMHIIEIDTLLERGMKENYKKSGMALVKKSLDLCLNLVEDNPNNYEVLWRCSRSCAQYAEAAFGLQAEQWKEISSKWGKRGMEFGAKAQKIEPERVEAYYWQLHSLGRYAKVTGLITAIREGFKKMSDHSIVKMYKIDKSYLDYSPVYMMAMRYYELPWPMKDKKKALKYYNEFSANTKWQWEPHLKYPNVAKLLIGLKKEHYIQEAKKLLDFMISDPHPRPYYQSMAKKLLKKSNEFHCKM